MGLCDLMQTLPMLLLGDPLPEAEGDGGRLAPFLSLSSSAYATGWPSSWRAAAFRGRNEKVKALGTSGDEKRAAEDLPQGDSRMCG